MWQWFTDTDPDNVCRCISYVQQPIYVIRINTIVSLIDRTEKTHSFQHRKVTTFFRLIIRTWNRSQELLLTICLGDSSNKKRWQLTQTITFLIHYDTVWVVYSVKWYCMYMLIYTMRPYGLCQSDFDGRVMAGLDTRHYRGPRSKLGSSAWHNSLITGKYHAVCTRRHVFLFPQYKLICW